MHDIIFVSLENWDEIWRRNQFLCSVLAKRYPKSKILFVGLAKDVSNHVRRGGKISDLQGQATYSLPEYPNITITRALKYLPNSVGSCRLINEAVMRRHVDNVARDLGLVAPILWLNSHSAVHMVGKMRESATIYDITDDWTEFTQSKSLTRLIRQQDLELCRRADAVIVCSQKLYDLKRNLAQHLYLIPNGVDAQHYSKVLQGTNSSPDIASRWPKPVLGYTGTIHPDRVDMNLVEAVARKMPHASIVLVGPVLLATQYVSRFKSLKNVFFTGPVPYSRLPDYMSAFDVCITPHCMTPFTESLNPIKLWEYLASGKPVVSTNVAGFRDYPRLVNLADDADSFVAAVQNALHEDPALQEERRAEARQHSWESRVDAVEAVIKTCLSKQEASHARP